MRALIGCLALGISVLMPCLTPANAQGAPRRIVILGGDITEIVFQLGEKDRIAGRDSTSTFPPEAKALPDVGYFRQLGAEGVLSLKPDLILSSASAGPPEVFTQIASTGVQIERLPDGHSTKALLDKIDRIAKVLGVPDKGADLTAKLSKDLAEAQSAVAAMPGHPKVLFIISAGGGAPLAAGRDTAADALIALAGAENVFSSYTGYKAISLEAAASAAPEAIAMMDHTLHAMGDTPGVASHPALRLTPAARQQRIVARDGSYLLSFGPRLPQVIVDFAQAIRGKEKS